MLIGILALQGGFAAHEKHLQALGQKTRLVRTEEDMMAVDALVIPGGESTTIYHLLQTNRLVGPLARFDRPIFATCAGLILMSKEIQGECRVQPFGKIDITCKRNAYGRQLDSFVGRVDFKGEELPGVFIRAPKVLGWGPSVEVLGTCVGEAVLLREGNILVATFHPELSATTRIHELFLTNCHLLCR